MITAVMPTYGRWDVAVERGEGCYLYATDGRKFLDFTSGIAVTSLGHCHPHVIEAVTEQAKQLWHISNLFRIPGQERLAERLVDNSFADTVFFNNSGAEAVELSIKVARKYQSETGHPERYRVIGCNGSFHGRSFATLAAAGRRGLPQGLRPGDGRVRPRRLRQSQRDARRDHRRDRGDHGRAGAGRRRRAGPARRITCKGLRAICDEFGLLLVYDEVQCGMGRTGKLFAHEWAGVAPDIMAVAKALGNGFPIGACLATEKAAVGMVAGHARLDLWRQPDGGRGRQRGARRDAGAGLLRRASTRTAQAAVGQARSAGRGLSEAVRRACAAPGCCSASAASSPAGDIVAKLRARRACWCLTAGDNVLRILPPLIVGEREIDEALDIIDKVAREWPAP